MASNESYQQLLQKLSHPQSRFRGRQLKFSKYLFMTIIAVKSPQGPVCCSDTVKPETETWTHTRMSNIFGVHRRTQRVTTWECSVMTLNTDLTVFFRDMSLALFLFVVVKMMAGVILFLSFFIPSTVPYGKY